MCRVKHITPCFQASNPASFMFEFPYPYDREFYKGAYLSFIGFQVQVKLGWGGVVLLTPPPPFQQ